MLAFETTAVLDDPSHLTLREPVPGSSVMECRVIVLFENEGVSTSPDWPPGFFEEIRIEDPTYARPAQGLASPTKVLDQVEGAA